MKDADIIREYGPFTGVEGVHGVTWDGEKVWFASGNRLNALDPASGEVRRSIEVPADAGTAFDGRYLFQLSGSRITRSIRTAARCWARYRHLMAAAPA